MEKITTVARDQAADKWRQIIFDDRSAGRHQTGSTRLTLVKTRAGSSDQQWVVTTCLDVSAVDIVDQNGRSVVSKTRPDRVRDVLTVQQDTSTSRWYVTMDEVTGTC